MKQVDIRDKKLVFDGFFKLEEAIVSFERFDGQMSEPVQRLRLKRGDSVAVFLFNKVTRQVVLTKQFRYAAYEKGPGWVVELVAGALETGEDAEETARREVLEEAGYRLNDLQHISTFYPSPGSSSERMILYYAEVSEADKVESGGGAEDESEDIQVLQVSVDDLLAQLTQGQIVDAKTIIGLLWVQTNILGQTRA